MKKRMRKEKGLLKKPLNKAVYLLAILPVVVFYWFVFKFSQNIPLVDDFDAILDFFIKFFQSVSLKEKLVLLFSQHNEHRLVIDRIIALLVYYINNSLDFKILIIIGNLSLLGLAVIIFQCFKQKKDKFLYFLPVVFLLFQPQYTGSIYWAISALQNLLVLLFVSLTIYFIDDKRRSFFVLAIVFAVLSAFTNGNGLFVFLIILGILMYRRRFHDALLWLFVTILVFAVYFHGYIMPEHKQYYIDFSNMGQAVIYFFAFIGSSVSLNFPIFKIMLSGFSEAQITILISVIGVIILLYSIFLIKNKYYKKNIKISAFFVFLFVCALSAALMRPGHGLTQAFSSRYKIISVLFLIFIYISAAEIIQAGKLKKYFPYILTAAIVFNIGSFYLNYNEIVYCRKKLVFGLADWQYNGTGMKSLYNEKEKGKEILSKSILFGYYVPPKINFDKYTSKRVPLQLPEETKNLVFSFNMLKDENNTAIQPYGWAFINGKDSAKSIIYFVLKSDKNTYVYKTEKVKRPDITAFFKTFNYDNSGFKALIHKLALEAGQYKIGIYIKDGGDEQLKITDRTIEVGK